MELLIGIGLVIFGGLLAYHNLKDSVDGEKSAAIFGGILLAIGIFLIDDFNDVAERERAENDRKWEMEQERLLQDIDNGRRLPFGSNSGFNGKYKCRSTGCACTIKRSELDSHELIRCSCGHLTSYHYD